MNSYFFFIVRRGYNYVLCLITYREKNILKMALYKPWKMILFFRAAAELNLTT